MSGKTASILVVDDHATNRLKISMAVKRLGYETRQADNGREALRCLSEEPIDLVLLDIVMPEMDGYEVLAAIKDAPELRDIPIIVISALDELDSVVKAIELGAEDYLPKAFDPVLLKARVGACLEKKQLRDLEIEYLRQVELLTDAAEIIEGEGFDPEALQLDSVTARDDALGRLARVLSDMAREVHAREQSLRQQVQCLQIEIDKSRQTEQVSSITGTDYFRDLRGRAGDLRTMLQDDGDGAE